ncbi:MAG: hypothetical protein ABIO57_02820 [Candidatus Paceibacterota bacterium]
MAKLTEQQNKIFALKHLLLHLLKSFSTLGFEVIAIKTELGELTYLALPDVGLQKKAIDFKHANLKTIVNILAMCHVVGLTRKKLATYEIPNEEKMDLIRGNNDDAVSFRDHLQYHMEKLAGLLESADHSPEANLEGGLELASGYILELYLCTIYWFDDEWVSAFLNEIPIVMKSK